MKLTDAERAATIDALRFRLEMLDFDLDAEEQKIKRAMERALRKLEGI